jgi:hypothetical protein
LDHEVWDQAVEGTAIVEAGGAEGEEVFGGFGNGFAEDFKFQIPMGGLELEGRLASWAVDGCQAGHDEA